MQLAGKAETPKDSVCRKFREVMGEAIPPHTLRQELDTAEVITTQQCGRSESRILHAQYLVL